MRTEIASGVDGQPCNYPAVNWRNLVEITLAMKYRAAVAGFQGRHLTAVTADEQ
jgi:hypothetical protein